MSTSDDRFNDDPFAEREAEKYEKPVPSREFILNVLSEGGQWLTFQQLCDHFTLESEDEFEGLRRRLRAMERDGQLIRNRRGGYAIVKKMDLLPGRIIGHPDGFGFLVPDDGGDDLYISAKRMRGVMHGDRVLARVSGIDYRGRKEAAPVEVIERANSKLVGRMTIDHGVAYVAPSNKRISQDIPVAPDMIGGAQDGHIVVVELIEQPDWKKQPIGKVIEVLGEHMAPGMEIDIALRSYEIPTEWPADVESQIGDYSIEVPESAKTEPGREDIRQIPLVTIDGEDSKDFDDAVYCEKNAGGWRLLVAIADVSHYVKPDSALDVEALNRGNSVYFPGQVVPMLPEILSNKLCSLNPDVDRLCMVCDMQIDEDGNTVSSRFFRAVMRSHARMTYTRMSAILEHNDAQLRQEYAALLPHFEDLYDLYKAFSKRRKVRGAIEFETTETRIVFDAARKIERIEPVTRNDAHRLIEECMIAANVATAEYLEQQQIPIVYRVHRGPTEEKVNDLRAFLGEYGLFLLGGSEPEPKHYANLLKLINQRPDAHLLTIVMLRSLSQAVYCPENNGHFGLSFDAYTHFTSPIRRYPDLLVHRALGHLIDQGSKAGFLYTEQNMVNFGEHCSTTERRADDATRDVMDWLKCEFVSDKIGEVHEGRVTAVTGFGLFVELDDMYVEGLIHVTSLDNDYYHHDSVNHRLMGERTRRIYQLSDRLKIRIVRADLETKKIDFELVEPGGTIASKNAMLAVQAERKKKAGAERGGKGGRGDKAGRGDKGQGKKAPAKKTADGAPKKKRSSKRRRKPAKKSP